MRKNRIFRIPLLGTRIAIAQDRHGSATRAKLLTGQALMETNLAARVIRNADYTLADGRIVNARDLRNYSEAEIAGRQIIEGTGYAVPVAEYLGNRKYGRLGNWIEALWNRLIYRDKTLLDLGSGLITNVAMLALSNDFNIAAPSGAAINLYKLANWHITGTGATAAAATDIALQTISANGGQTPVAGAQSLVSAANLQKYQTVATVSYTGTEAVTEWGLITQSTVSATTGSPFTATSATSGTVTGTPLTASSSTVQGQQQHIVQAGTTAVWGYVTSNSTSVLTIPAWYKTADGTAGSTPGSTETYTLRPIIFDHKVFSAVNVLNGDSIQFTYQATNVSGG